MWMCVLKILLVINVVVLLVGAVMCFWWQMKEGD